MDYHSAAYSVAAKEICPTSFLHLPGAEQHKRPGRPSTNGIITKGGPLGILRWPSSPQTRGFAGTHTTVILIRMPKGWQMGDRIPGLGSGFFRLEVRTYCLPTR